MNQLDQATVHVPFHGLDAPVRQGSVHPLDRTLKTTSMHEGFKEATSEAIHNHRTNAIAGPLCDYFLS